MPLPHQGVVAAAVVAAAEVTVVLLETTRPAMLTGIMGLMLSAEVEMVMGETLQGGVARSMRLRLLRLLLARLPRAAMQQNSASTRGQLRRRRTRRDHSP